MKGKKRAEKFKAKHEPNVILLRWKALRDFNLQKIQTPQEQLSQALNLITMLIEKHKIKKQVKLTVINLLDKAINQWDFLPEFEKNAIIEQLLTFSCTNEIRDEIEYANKLIRQKEAQFIHAPIIVTLEANVFVEEPIYEEEIEEEAKIFGINQYKKVKNHKITYQSFGGECQTDQTIKIQTILTSFPTYDYQRDVKIKCWLNQPFLNDLTFPNFIQIKNIEKNVSEQTTTKKVKTTAKHDVKPPYKGETETKNIKTIYETIIT